MLTSEDLNDLRLVCLFAPHQSQQFPDSCLSGRRCDAIDNSLTWIEGFNRLKEEFWSLSQERSASIISWNDEWKPPNTIAPLDAPSIADCIDKEICAAFCSIPFRDWVRAALGYTSDSVENLIAGVPNLRVELRYRFTKLHEPTDKYKLVKKVSNFAVISYRKAKNTVRNYSFDILWHTGRYPVA